MATRVGVDVGGTFTDLTFYDDDTGEVRLGKEPTTSAAPHEAVITAVRKAVAPEQLGASEYFLHGTTVGLNSLLTRTGAVVGLLSTRGFRDVLEIRRGDRDDPYNLFWKQPAPLVPRSRRIPIPERTLPDGSVHTPLDEAEVRRAGEAFVAEGVTSVAIAFLHSYANPTHELAAESVLRDAGFEGTISLSHRVSGEYREYERTTTTVVDAYVRPRMSNYLGRLREELSGLKFRGDLLVTRSGGGALTFAEAEERPFETILSGPVAGAEGAAELARNLELGDMITADVGGTSFDTCLIVGGRPTTMYEGRIVGLPVQSPWVDVRSIGAGGGSIAYVDVGGLLRVGPQSAGAHPGPACYRRGGTEPTVTDAALVLGMLGEGVLASGLRLGRDEAQQALAPLANRMSFDAEGVARGVVTIVTANMANAIREITVEQGQDPRRAVLAAFGGAGPLFATLLARELEITEIVIPPYAGNFSAWGLLGADLTQSAARTRVMRFDEDTIAAADQVLDELFAALTGRGSTSSGRHRSSREVRCDMRYVGQEHTITVSIPNEDGRIAATLPEMRQLFTDEYERTFAHSMDEEVEIVSLRATVRTPLPRRAERFVTSDDSGEQEATAPVPISAYSFARGEWLEFNVVQRSSLVEGARMAGPAILLEETATTYLDADFEAEVDSSHALFIHDTRRAN